MLAHTIAFVAGESILRIIGIKSDHEPVAGDFGDDAGGRDAQAERVAGHQRGVLHGEAADGKAVNQGVIRPRRQRVDGSGHGEVRGAENVELVDVRDGRLGRRPENVRVASQCGVKFFALGRGDFFGVGQSVESEAVRQNDRGGDNRAGQRSASGLVDSRDQNKTAGAQGALAAEIAGHGCGP